MIDRAPAGAVVQHLVFELINVRLIASKRS